MSVGSTPLGPWRYLFTDEGSADDPSLQSHSKGRSNGEASNAPTLGKDQKCYDDERSECRRQGNKRKLLPSVQDGAPNCVDPRNYHNRRQHIEQPPGLRNFLRAKAGSK